MYLSFNVNGTQARVAYSHRSVNRLTRANWIKMDQNGRLLLNVTKMQQILERKENRDRTFCDLRFDGLGIGKWQGGAVWAYLRGVRRVLVLFYRFVPVLF